MGKKFLENKKDWTEICHLSQTHTLRVQLLLTCPKRQSEASLSDVGEDPASRPQRPQGFLGLGEPKICGVLLLEEVKGGEME